MRKSSQLIWVLVFTLLCGQIQAQINTDLSDTTKKVLYSTNKDLQTVLDQVNPRRYKVAELAVSGNASFDTNLLRATSGITVGSFLTIPGGDELSRSIHRLWVQGFFSDITYYVTKISGNEIFLELHVTERPRVTRFYFKGVGKTQADELKGKSGITPGHALTENMKMNAVDAIRSYYGEKGFRRVSVDIIERKDTTFDNSVLLYFNINKGQKVKVNQIDIFGNEAVDGAKLKKQMKGTKEVSKLTLFPTNDAFDTTGWGTPYRYDFHDYMKDQGYFTYTKTRSLLSPYVHINPLASAKFNEKKYREDKQKLIDYYNSKGYRDAKIVKDSIYYTTKGNINVDVKVNEGHKYYFGNIKWVGNTIYPDSLLTSLLDIRKGDVYNKDLMNEKLGIPSSEGLSVSNLYLDNGYLFFQVDPIEESVYGDTIDFVMNMREGPEATLTRVNIVGNDKTNEHVIRRALRTLPGDKFSKSDIMMSLRELSVLKFFDEQKMNPEPAANQADGTVELTYNLVEKSADQLQLSAGFGGGIGLTGTLGVTFNNFSIHNIFNRKGWAPLPTGDGQTLSVNFQSNGKAFRSYSVQFVEPWLGGKHQNALSLSFADSKFRNGYNYMTGQWDSQGDTTSFRTTSVSVGLSKRLDWPDPYFQIGAQLNLTRYQLKNYYIDQYNLPNYRNGVSNNINMRFTLSRNSVNSAQYPTGGSNLMVYAQLTPPYSLFDKSIENVDEKADPAKKYKFVEYQKYRFTGDWYVPIGQARGDDHKQFVLKASVKMGYLGKYNSNMPISPFERFQLGDAGMSNNYALLGYDIISQRGYPVYEESNPRYNPDQSGATRYFTIFNKYSLELRYPLSLSQASTIFGLVFAEAANGWYSFKDYNPFQLRRDVGVGARFYLPMFGLLGFDYGIGLDRLRDGQGIGKASRFTFMLGYEPD